MVPCSTQRLHNALHLQFEEEHACPGIWYVCLYHNLVDMLGINIFE